MTLSCYYEGSAKYFLGENGRLGQLVVNRSEIKKLCSENNKISSTLFKFSSEIKKLAPSYLPLFLG